MRKFSINSFKQILDLYGNRFIVKGVTFLDYLFNSFESRTTLTQRGTTPPSADTAYINPIAPRSQPTFFEPEMWRSDSHISAQIQKMCDMGINTIRVGIDPAIPYTDASVQFGVSYPPHLDMLDRVIDLAGQKGMLVILTMGYPFVATADYQATLTFFANRYRTGGIKESPFVAINPKNEINCQTGGTGCTTSSMWVSDQATNVATIRATGFDGLIILNPNNFGHDLVTCEAGFLANTTLANDPSIVIGVHSYQRLGTDVDFNAARISYETSSWYAYANTFCIINEESGIYNFTGRYDPNLDSTLTATDPTSWAQMQAYKTSEMDWYVNAITNDNVNGLIACRWNTYSPYWASGLGAHDDNSLVRRDGSLTTWGIIFNTYFLKAMTGITPPPSYTTIFAETFTSQSGAASGYLFANVYSAGAFSASATALRFTLTAPASSSMVIAAAYIGQQAATGDPYDFFTTPTQIKFSGNSGITLASGVSAISDDLTFTLDNTKNYVIRVALTSGAVGYGGSMDSYYYEAGAASSVATINISGMSIISGNHSIISKIESKP